MAAAGERTADVIGAVGHPDGRTRGLDWTLGQTAAHIVADVQAHRAWLRGEGKVDYFVSDLPEENLRGIESVKERDPAVLAAIVRHDNAAFVSEAAGQPAGAAFAPEAGPDLSLAGFLRARGPAGADLARPARRVGAQTLGRPTAEFFYPQSLTGHGNRQ